MSNKTDIYNKIRTYNGSNDFLRKMQESLQKWGRLTDKQYTITEKIVLNEERQKEVDVTTLSPQLRSIVEYNGDSTFVQDLKSKYLTYRTLSDKQIQKGAEAVNREVQKNSQVDLNLKLVGNTIKLGRKIAEGIKENKNIDFFPILVDVTEVMTMSNKAFKLKAKLTKENGGICRCCGKTLTDYMSQITGIGPVCAKYVGVEHPKSVSEVEKFKADMSKKIDEIGEFEFWIPKRQIVEWNGAGAMMLKIR